MTIIDQLHSGLDAGVERYWRYTKELFNIKPEYLMTVAVADALTNGYDGASGIDIEIRLETPTRTVAYAIVTQAVGLKSWFSVKKEIKINRKGKIDIFSTLDSKSHAIELKGFDPSKPEIVKELVRIQEFLLLNSGKNSLVAGHVVFPSLRSYEKKLKKYGQLLFTDSVLTYDVSSRKQETGEDPDDGIPVYFTNSISVKRADA